MKSSRIRTLSVIVGKKPQTSQNPHRPPLFPPSVPFTRGGSRRCPCVLLPPSLPVFPLNRCQHWVNSSPEGLPAAYWFIINEIRAAVCRGGFDSQGGTEDCMPGRQTAGEIEEDRRRRMDGAGSHGKPLRISARCTKSLFLSLH